MSRQLLLSCHTIRCDVGYGLAAGDGERVAVTPVAVALAVGPAVGIPVGPVGERGLDILAARVGNGGVVPAVADSLHGHVVGGLRTDGVRHLHCLPCGGRLVVHGHRSLLHRSHARAHGAELAVLEHDGRTGGLVVLAAIVVPLTGAVGHHELDGLFLCVLDGVGDPAVARRGHLHAWDGGPGAVSHAVVQVGGVCAEIGARVEHGRVRGHRLLAGHRHRNGRGLAAGSRSNRRRTLLHERD